MNLDSAVEHAFVIGHLLALASPAIIVAAGVVYMRNQKRRSFQASMQRIADRLNGGGSDV